MPRQFGSEWEFTQAVIKLAEECEWEKPFHIPARAYQNATIPEGFPDLLLRRRDNLGGITMVVVELKTDDEERSKVSAEQRAFLEDFAKQQIPAFIFRYRDWDYIEKMLWEGPPDATGEIIEPSLPIVRNTEWLPPRRTVDAVVPKIVADIGDPYFQRGDLAALRRMNPDTPDTAPFWRIMESRGLSDNPDLESRWALILHGIALMTPNAHDSNVSVGKALYEGGDSSRTNAFYSRLRFNRMLTARGSILRTFLSQLFRMMKVANQPFDWREMAWFILSESDYPEVAEKARIRMSRDYYGTEYRNSPNRTA